MKKVMFDIGCNQGRVCDRYVYHGWNVFAFEPNPILISELRQKFKNYNNFILTEKAVSDFTGKSIFNVANTRSPAGTLGGCSSLLEFNDDLDDKWPSNRKGEFVTTEKIEVDVISLDVFIKNKNIQNIDFFKCDTQGNDLSVLKGLGEYINIIDHGQVEVGNVEDPLYKNSNYLKKEVIDYLESYNFKITRIEQIDPKNFESNLYFEKNK